MTYALFLIMIFLPPIVGLVYNVYYMLYPEALDSEIETYDN